MSSHSRAFLLRVQSQYDTAVPDHGHPVEYSSTARALREATLVHYTEQYAYGEALGNEFRLSETGYAAGNETRLSDTRNAAEAHREEWTASVETPEDQVVRSLM